MIKVFQNVVAPTQESIGRPIRLRIPIINVDANVQYVGLTKEGAMDVPEGWEDVAWFDVGSHPGELGSAVIAGHYGTLQSGETPVFNDLNKLQKGDKLSVEDENGLIVSFVVREIRSFDQEADASTVFNSNDGKAHLNLITCEGVWNEGSQSYPSRLVVFTDKE